MTVNDVLWDNLGIVTEMMYCIDIHKMKGTCMYPPIIVHVQKSILIIIKV